MTIDPALSWSPAPGVHPAQVDEDLVLLDLRSDRYVCVPGGSGGAAWDRVSGRLRLVDPPLAKAFAAAGLIQPCCEARPADPAPPPPVDSAVPDRAGRLRGADLAPLLRATADHSLAYRGRSLSKLISAAQRRRPTAPAGRETVLAVTAAFHRWLPYAPVPAKCLVRSFLLLRALHRAGGDAAWMFGVKTWPFRAHCWLQLDGTVLDDDVETVRAYAPILVV